jgi:hypothetical protein
MQGARNAGPGRLRDGGKLSPGFAAAFEAGHGAATDSGHLGCIDDGLQTLADEHLVTLLPVVVENRRKYGSKRPEKKLSTLQNALTVSFPKLNAAGISALLALPQRKRHVFVQGTEVSYPELPEAPAPVLKAPESRRLLP